MLIETGYSSDKEQKLHLGNGIAAIAEGEIITFEQLRKRLDPLVPKIRIQASNEQEFTNLINSASKEILQNMIDQILIVKDAYDKGIQIPTSYVDDEYENIIKSDFNGNRSQFLMYLKSLGKNPDEFRDEIKKNIIISYMRTQNFKNQSQISPEKIESFYNKNKINFYQHESIHLKQIILTPETNETIEKVLLTADEIIKQLDSGITIDVLANQYGNSKYNRLDGDWGWVRREDLKTELTKIAFNLKIGEYSKPIRLGNSVFILYAENFKEECIQPISEVREVIEKLLTKEIAQISINDWLDKLRANAYIKYYL